MIAGCTSVVVPTLNEAAVLPALLARLRAIKAAEVIVADGGSRDDTVAIAQAAGARVILAAAGRGSQLRAGCAAAAGAVLWILHADARPPEGAWRWIDAVTARGHAGAFRLRIDHPARAFRLVEVGAWLRTAATGLPYGDQGMFMTRDAYDRAGGFPDWPLFEDVGLAQRLAQAGVPIELLPAALSTSARRWLRDGVLERTLRNWGLAMAYHAMGADPHALARLYPPEVPRG